MTPENMWRKSVVRAAFKAWCETRGIDFNIITGVNDADDALAELERKIEEWEEELPESDREYPDSGR